MSKFEVGQPVIYIGDSEPLKGQPLTVKWPADVGLSMMVTNGRMDWHVRASDLKPVPMAPALTVETVTVGHQYVYVGYSAMRGQIVRLCSIRADGLAGLIETSDKVGYMPIRDLIPLFKPGDPVVYIGRERPDLFGKELRIWPLAKGEELTEPLELPGFDSKVAWQAPRADLRHAAPKPQPAVVWGRNRIENCTIENCVVRHLPERVTVRVGAEGVEYDRTYLMGGTVVDRQDGVVKVRLDTPDGRHVTVQRDRVMLMPEDWVDPVDRLLAELKTELVGAMLGHGPLHNAHEGYAVLLEEVRELEAEVFKNPKKHVRRIREEGIQVSAMGLRLILDTLDAPWAKPDPEPTKPD